LKAQINYSAVLKSFCKLLQQSVLYNDDNRRAIFSKTSIFATHMNLTKNTHLAFLAGAMFLAPFFYAQANAQGTAKTGNSVQSAEAKNTDIKLAQFLEKSGGFAKISDVVWTKPSEGKSIGKYNTLVFISPDRGQAAIVVKVAETKNIKLSKELLMKLVTFSAQSVKVGMTEDGDIVIAGEMSGRLMDWQEFSDVNTRVSEAADKLYSKISGDLVSGSK
jgi:hypothetical protein